MRPLFFMMDSSSRNAALIACGAFVAILLLAWLAYRPGLGGGFLFDDFANLPSLGETGPIDNAAAFWRYVTSGSADPTGRPLALVSFLIDANDWPADPYPFKRTSLLLHLLNGVLLTLLLLKLGRALGKSDRQSAYAALLGAAIWLLHPLFLSTTLYVVQRESILPAAFVLVGLLGYIRGRELAAQGRRIGVFVAGLSIVVCTLLAVLCKANGALLPLLAWIVDGILLAPIRGADEPQTRGSFAITRWIVLVMPSILLFAFLGKVAYSGLTNGIGETRPWTLGERLFSESHALVEYLRLLWLPHPFSTGLFNDSFPASHGLFSPPTTLLCALFVAMLPLWAWNQRRRHPALAASILFFFAGHLLESTVIPLELYFEHRNYLPAMLLFWPFALWLCAPSRKAATAGSVAVPPLPALRTLLAIALPPGLAYMTFLGAGMWGDVNGQAMLWAAKNPESPRAQAYAAQIEVARGQVPSATTRLERALEKAPRDLQLTLNLMGAKCAAGNLTPADLERAASALRNARNAGRLGYDWFVRALSTSRDGSCPGLDLDALDRLLVAAGENSRTEKIPGRRQDRLHLQGRIALLRGDSARALELFNAAIDADTRPSAALEQAAILASAKQAALAQDHLDHLGQVWTPPAAPGWTMPSFHAWLLWKQGYWNNEISHMRMLLAEDIAVQRAGDRSIMQGQR